MSEAGVVCEVVSDDEPRLLCPDWAKRSSLRKAERDLVPRGAQTRGAFRVQRDWAHNPSAKKRLLTGG